jgi:glycosyltransferase involved in cell wall biosynthesis
LRLRFIAHRIEPYKVLRWLVPDAHSSWILPGFIAAQRLIKRYDPEVIVTTAMPFSAHMIGLLLKMAQSRAWVVDYQDPWSQNPFLEFPTTLHRRLIRRLDRAVLRKADLVLGTTPLMTEALYQLSAIPDRQKFHTVWLGFDTKERLEGDDPEREADQLIISYVGSLYGLRRGEPFLSTVDSLVERGEIDESCLQVIFVGKDGTGETKRYREKAWFGYQGTVPHETALDRMRQSDCLLLLVNREALAQVPMKTFEYLAMGKPILALAPLDSSAAYVVESTRTGFVVDPEDVDMLARVLLELYHCWQADEMPGWFQPDSEVIDQFDRRRQVETLVGHLESLVQGMPGVTGE